MYKNLLAAMIAVTVSAHLQAAAAQQQNQQLPQAAGAQAAHNAQAVRSTSFRTPQQQPYAGALGVFGGAAAAAAGAGAGARLAADDFKSPPYNPNSSAQLKSPTSSNSQ